MELPPLIPAARFKSHSEKSDEYVELYMHVHRVLEEHYDWGLHHPETINKKDLIPRSVYYERPSKLPNRNADLCPLSLVNFVFVDVSTFQALSVERVVEKLRDVGYRILYGVRGEMVEKPEAGDFVHMIQICL